MSDIAGHATGWVYRVAWRVKATGYENAGGSMTREMATAWKEEMAARSDGIEYWVEEYNGREWVNDEG